MSKIKTYKLCTLGKSGVGKSALIASIVYDKFSTPEPTVGMACLSKTIADTKVQIWDTAGQERFDSLVSSYIRSAHIVLLCTDETDIEAFKIEIRRLQLKVEDRNTKIFIVSTKIDLSSVIDATDELAYIKTLNVYAPMELWAATIGIPYYSTSSKNSYGVNKLTLAIFNACHQISIPSSVSVLTISNEPRYSYCSC